MGHASSTSAPALPSPDATRDSNPAVQPKVLMQPTAATPATPAATPSAPVTPVAASPAPASSSSSWWSYVSWTRPLPNPPPAPVPATTTTASAPVPAAAVPVSLHTLAPPPPVLAQKQPATFKSFLPVLGGCALLMAGSVAYGVRYGTKQAQKMEENYSQYEVKPTAEPEIEITPEMRRYALRRAMQAFGIGTVLTLSTGAAVTYGVSRYWEVNSIKEFSNKLTVVFADVRMPFESSATRIVDGFDRWISMTWFGRWWTTNTGPKISHDIATQAEVLRQEQEMKDLWDDAKKMQQEWNEGKLKIGNSKAIVKLQQQELEKQRQLQQQQAAAESTAAASNLSEKK